MPCCHQVTSAFATGLHAEQGYVVPMCLQALISAVFSIVFQAISQGFFPRFHVHHTSDHVGSYITLCICDQSFNNLRICCSTACSLEVAFEMHIMHHKHLWCSHLCQAAVFPFVQHCLPNLLVVLCMLYSAMHCKLMQLVGVWASLHSCGELCVDGLDNDCSWHLPDICQAWRSLR